MTVESESSQRKRKIEREGEGKNGRPWKRSAIDHESTRTHQQDPVLTAGFEAIIRTIRLLS